MRISKKAWRRLATAVAVPASALGALAGFVVPAMAGTTQPPSPDETFYAYGAAGSEADFPVYASGVFTDQGHLGVTGDQATVVLRHGDILFGIPHSRSSWSVAQQSCNATETLTFSYTITRGTERYNNARGTGLGSIEISAVLRRHDGTCDTGDPVPNTIRITLDASGTFTQGS